MSMTGASTSADETTLRGMQAGIEPLNTARALHNLRRVHEASRSRRNALGKCPRRLRAVGELSSPLHERKSRVLERGAVSGHGTGGGNGVDEGGELRMCAGVLAPGGFVADQHRLVVVL
jgi:hypothetical protein